MMWDDTYTFYSGIRCYRAIIVQGYLVIQLDYDFRVQFRLLRLRISKATTGDCLVPILQRRLLLLILANVVKHFLYIASMRRWMRNLLRNAILSTSDSVILPAVAWRIQLIAFIDDDGSFGVVVASAWMVAGGCTILMLILRNSADSSRLLLLLRLSTSSASFFDTWPRTIIEPIGIDDLIEVIEAIISLLTRTFI